MSGGEGEERAVVDRRHDFLLDRVRAAWAQEKRDPDDHVLRRAVKREGRGRTARDAAPPASALRGHHAGAGVRCGGRFACRPCGRGSRGGTRGARAYALRTGSAAHRHRQCSLCDCRADAGWSRGRALLTACRA
jgi:hypothetical protein